MNQQSKKCFLNFDDTFHGQNEFFFTKTKKKKSFKQAKHRVQLKQSQ